MPVRVEKIGSATLYLADSTSLRSLPPDAALVSDVPYGADLNMNFNRISGGAAEGSRGRCPEWDDVKGDDEPFDPAPWLGWPEVILFGSNHFAEKLPRGQTLIWLKKQPHLYGTFLSDAEVAWQKSDGWGVFCYYEPWASPRRMKQGGGRSAHPTQKPVGLMEWCVRRTKAGTILDPFMGSGTTGVAAINLGRQFVGVEISEKHFETACRRIAEAVARPMMAFD